MPVSAGAAIHGAIRGDDFMANIRKLFGQYAIAAAILSAAITAFPLKLAAAEMVTECTVIGLCYCVNKDYQKPINDNITRVRQLIAEQKAAGKAIGYLSVPLSTLGGGLMIVNMDVAARTKEAIERRLGQHSAWMLNPGAEGNLGRASGADYMYMWTKILEGRSGLGEDFDFFYFVGPSAFRLFFALDGNADMEKLEAYFDTRYANDQKFHDAVDQYNISKRKFRDYYALRASVSFSFGSHDEWNIARMLNERRRGAADFGIGSQLGIMYDGRSAAPGEFDASVAGGDVGRCIN
jgi:hypothetical protein